MTAIASELNEEQTNGILEMMELLCIDVLEEEDVSDKVEDVLRGTPERELAPLSKNVLRKQRHWERKLAARKSKRKEEKLRRKLNRQTEDVEHPPLTKRVMKAVTKERLAEARSSGVKVCVDLGMTHRMSDKETSRLAAQIRRLYGSNKRASKPFHLFLTSFRENSRLLAECVRMNAGFLNYTMERTEQSCLDIFPPGRVVYLSPDAQEALERVDRNTVYVLGGLVDESIQKTLSLSRAAELGVRVARLPIDEHMQKIANRKNFHSKILAINQVFDILLAVCDTGSWTHALDKCFPAGKGFAVAS
ncbi:tRNA methyltransferase 10 homolog B isoform X3 [Syngnathus scovelli]|uniref:tRNA methyltransferase 10 homolog B isoform X3 n=1 Tax=Syngnathus scovelli TaxID=161590 RepID=UPI00210F5B28|nr:tRNA methyltransferase 10 homolog B isoform X1 [Syngnathus scovelli]XP_049612639.1 tRNA methyltransferase 10 homolog B isoform X1 [Syngnathus scovelli]XP_049613493.1 tRNA methyltransferase 10 homolog B isoform X1 [Syngnathus scovelli]